MDRQSTFLLALGLLIAAALVVSVSGWVLFARDRRAGRVGAAPLPDEAPEGETEPPGAPLDRDPGHLPD